MNNNPRSIFLDIKKILKKEKATKINDDEFNALIIKDENVEKRNEYYTDLVENFKDSLAYNDYDKQTYKKAFFWTTLILLISVVAVSIIGTILAICFLQDAVSLITTISTATIGMLSSIIVLPRIIAKYLFNPKEDKPVSDMVQQMIEYDKNIRYHLHGFTNKKINEKNKEKKTKKVINENKEDK